MIRLGSRVKKLGSIAGLTRDPPGAATPSRLGVWGALKLLQGARAQPGHLTQLGAF